jgi:hypothetical protein
VDLRRASGTALAPLRPLLSRGAGMTPGYLVVGTKRGGSTSAYDWISKHPEVAPCRTKKGTHYFDVNYARGERWFRSGFEKPQPGWRITGEASPYYMFHPHAMERIAATLPDVKLIAVLREPVARIWSHHQYELAMGTETLDFEQALAQEDERLEGEVERMLADPTYESFEHRHHAYTTRGCYAEQIEAIYTYFPPEQLLIVQSESLFEDPAGELTRVWDFLGLSRVTLEGLTAMKQNSYDAKLPEGMAARLRDYYRPHNERLYALPDVTFRWTDPEEGSS